MLKRLKLTKTQILIIPLYIIAANASPYPQGIVNDNLAAAQNFQSEIKSGKYLPELYSGESGKYGDSKPVKSGTFQGTQLETPKYIASNGGESLGGTFLSPGIVPAQNVKSEGEQVSGSQLVALTSDIYTGSHVLDSIDYNNDRIEAIQDNTQPNKGREDRLSELATLKVQKSSIATTSANIHQGAKLNSDTYWQYTGDGSIDAGWPAKDRWISFESM